MQSIRVMVVDGHLLFREALRGLLARYEDIEVIGEASGGHQALEVARQAVPDVILLDLQMTGMDGIEVCRRLKAAVPSCRVIILTVLRELSSIAEAVKAGASAFLTKETGSRELVDTIRRTYHEGDLLGPAVADRLLAELPSPEARGVEAGLFAALSPRETQILKLLAEGLANKTIAGRLSISEHTVRNHISNIFQKLQVKDRTEAAVMAVKGGLV